MAHVLAPTTHTCLYVRKEAEKRRSETRAILVECCKGKLPDLAVEVVLDSLQQGSVPLEWGLNSRPCALCMNMTHGCVSMGKGPISVHDLAYILDLSSK